MENYAIILFYVHLLNLKLRYGISNRTEITYVPSEVGIYCKPSSEKPTRDTDERNEYEIV